MTILVKACQQALTTDPMTGRQADDGPSVLAIVWPERNFPRYMDFSSGFLSHIGSLGFSQILDSLIMIKPRVSRTLI